MCTDVHRSFGWWVSRPSRELCSLDLASVDRASTGRSKPRIDRPGSRPSGCNGQKFDRWPVYQPVDRQQDFLLSWLQRLYFGACLYGAVLGCLREDFWRVSKLVFPISCRGFSTCFRANIFISKGEFTRVFCKSDFLSFSPQNLS